VEQHFANLARVAFDSAPALAWMLIMSMPTELLAKVVKRDVKIVSTPVLLSIALCSCAVHNDAYIHHNLVGLTVTGNDQQVTVAHVRNEMDGQRLADKHCKQFGKSAQFDRLEGVRAIYDCQSGSRSVNR
jgi:hypothetical protein